MSLISPHKGGGNILSIAVEGGTEKALTTGSGISDDRDYSADGKWIYFNSDHAGGSNLADTAGWDWRGAGDIRRIQ